MIAPDPSALLLDHPAIPLLEWCREEDDPASRVETDPGRLTARDRRRAATQLVAVAALLSEHDLWPGPKAVRQASVRRRRTGVQVELGALPRPLTTMSRRLGGGQAAAERLRQRFLSDLEQRFAVDLPAIAGEGYFLEPWLRELLTTMGGDIDPITARNLWLLRWPLPSRPESGEVAFWATPTADVGARIGAALWADSRRRGRAAWLRRLGGDEVTAPLPAVGTSGLMVLVGTVTEEELAGVVRWAERPGCSAVAVGQFPRGWQPPPVPLDEARLEHHLSFVGASLERCRAAVDRRRGRFHPLSLRDRHALTETAASLAAPPSAATESLQSEPLTEWLRLLPSGLPEGFVRLHVRMPTATLERRAEILGVVRRDGRWRLAACPPLVPDPRHRLIAEMFATDDPRRLLHHSLADTDPTRLLSWCRSQLERLATEELVDVLADVARGALGAEVEGVFAAACLLRCDLARARLAIAAMPAALSTPLRQWLAVVDREPDRVGLVTEHGDAETTIAAAAVALDRLRRGTGAKAARGAVSQIRQRCRGPIGGWLAIELAAFEAPAKLRDRAWRRAVAADHAGLRGRLLQLLALQCAEDRPALARRTLARLAAADLSPGQRGLLELDRGYVELTAGDSGAADRHSLRALRLLDAAGFRGRTRTVRFNLAVADLDRLRVRSAAARLAQLDPDDPFVIAEQARHQLAVGDEPALAAAIERLLAVARAGTDPRLAEAASLLAGVRALLAGSPAAAEQQLAGGGVEAAPWIALSRVMRGLPGHAAVQHDGWGVGLAAEWLRSGELEEPATPAPDGLRQDLRSALAVALVARLGGNGRVSSTLREAAAVTLNGAGLVGWARTVRRQEGSDGVPLDAVANLLEAEDPAALGAADLEPLTRWLGVGGLEVRQPGAAAVIWRSGDGEAGAATRSSGIEITPLGGEPSAVEWRIVTRAIGLVLGGRWPAAAVSEGVPEGLGMVGTSPAMVALRRELERLAPTRISLLLIGETGTGKELAARAIHRLSRRRGGFVPVNIAAVPDNLLEAELFGVVRGAFTGAERSRRGLAAAADGGTLFLDEIGDLALPLQVKLLRFLESGEVRPVGSDVVSRVDVRIVAATHHDLAARVKAGSFRQDLFFRIATSAIPLPALRERRSDIPLLRATFEREAVLRHEVRPCRWSRAAEAALEDHDWPGNVRELRHVVEVAMVRAAGGTVTVEQLPFRPPPGRPPTTGWDEALREFKRALLAAALARNGGNRSATARELGLSRQALLYHLRTLGVS